MGTLAAVLVSGIGPAAAQSDEAAEKLAVQTVDELAASGLTWQAWADGRTIVPSVGLPHELLPSAGPFTRAFVDSTPGGSAGFASFYYGDEILEEGAFEIGPGGGFKNPTLTRCANPGNHGPGGTVEMGTAKAVSDCSSPLAASGVSNTGPVVTEGVEISDGFSRSSTNVSKDGRLVSETTVRLLGLAAGDLAIDSILSWVKVDHLVETEPQVSYRIAVTGIRSGKDSPLDASSPTGFTLAGNNVPSGELLTQFNSQMNEIGETAAPDSQQWRVDVMAPRIYKEGETPGRSFTDFAQVNANEIAVIAPFLHIRTDNKACCFNKPGDNSGAYVALARVRSYIDSTGSKIGEMVLSDGYKAEDQTPYGTGPGPASAPESNVAPAAVPAVAVSETPAVAPAAPRPEPAVQPASTKEAALSVEPVTSSRPGGTDPAPALLAGLGIVALAGLLRRPLRAANPASGTRR